jgi:hypothetical protein
MKTNPLNLTINERKNITKKMNNLKGNRIISNKTQKNQHQPIKNKYKTRNSPPYPANENCNKIMIGNDGKKYKSISNKNGICSWKKIK